MFHSSRRRLLTALLLLSSVVSLWPAMTATPPAQAAPVSRSSRARTIPLSFVRNVGQRDPAVRFEARSMGGMIFFTPGEVVLALPTAHGQTQRPHDLALDPAASAAGLPATVVRLSFDGANAAPAIVGVDPLPGRANYLIGSDPARWQTGLQTNAGLIYQQLYPGIDLRYDGLDSQLKATYLVASGADPLAIRWRYAGAESLRIDRQGNLEITLPTAQGRGKARTLVEAAPIAWQELGARRQPVTVSYTLVADGSVGFALGAYDPTQPLVIDPTLSYGSYLGGTGSESGFNLAVDSAGNSYLVGETFSANFPIKGALQPGYAGGYDVIVTKLNPFGDGLVYSTYLGGSNDDRGRGVAVDASGAIVVSGFTLSTNFPTKNAVRGSNGDQDGFVARLQPDGATLSFSTYLGGALADSSVRVAVDAEQNVYVTGATYSSNFPTTVGAFQTTAVSGLNAYVVKLPADGGRLIYGTFLAGSGDDVGYDVAVDAAGAAHVVGRTTSTNFPTFNAVQSARGGATCFNCADLFVTQLSPAGDRLGYSTYLGGSGEDAGYAIALDSTGAAHVTGGTQSADFPKQRAPQPAIGGSTDAFVAKLAAGGNELVYSTYLGGSGVENGLDLDLDRHGNVALIGETGSFNLPLVDPIATSNRGGYDVLVAGLSAAGDRWLYTSYLGGSSDDRGRGIAVAQTTGALYLTGETLSANFPTCPSGQSCPAPLQPSYGGGRDSFLVVLTESFPPTAPTNLRADDVTGSALTLSWDAATDDIGVVEYTIYQDGALLGTTSATTLAVGGLRQGAIYRFSVSARDAAGNVSPLSAELAVGIPDVTAPVMPGDLAVVSTTASSVRLVWAPATDNVAVTGYNVYNGTTLVDTTSATVYSVTGLEKNKTYIFTVQAYDAAGNLSAASNVVTVKVKG